MNKYDRPRIAHLNFCPSMGVYKKIAGQAKAAERADLNMDFYILTDKPLPPADNLIIIPFDWPKNKLKRKFARNFKTFKLLTDLTDLKIYDRIILRYPTAVDLSYKGFLKKYGNRFITEHHADVIGELKILEQGFLNPLRICLEKRNAPKILSHSCGIIGVTDEIRQIYLKESGGHKPSIVISNGIDVQSVPFSGFQPFNQDPLKLLFVSSTFYAGHGLDRLLRGLNNYRGKHTIFLTLVGRIYRREEIELLQSLNNPQVKWIRHEQLDGKELDRVFSQANLAVSTLALFRDGITQACPLKTREYMARGLPFVYSYEDMDLDEDLTFCLKIPANNEAVQIDDLFKFAAGFSHSKETAQQMRRYAEIRLDWSVKMEKMYAFACSTE